MSNKVRRLFTEINEVTNTLEHQYNIPTVQIYLAVDYDDCADVRFRRADIEDKTHPDGQFSLQEAVSSKDYGKVMYALPKPSKELLKNWQNLKKQKQRREYLTYPDSLRKINILIPHSILGKEEIYPRKHSNKNVI